MAIRVLLADDEPDFREMVAIGLESEGHEVVQVGDGAAAVEALSASSFDIVICDVNMPRLDGFTVCRRVRESHPELPFILLTSRDTEIDEALGLDLGADDYVTKPVSNRVLAARIRALMRRKTAREEPPSEPVVVGRLRLVPHRLEAFVDDVAVELTVTEFRLLSYFAAQPGRVLERERLLRAMRDDASFVSERMVDSYVNRVRRKIEQVAPGFDAIETVIGMGYRLRDP